MRTGLLLFIGILAAMGIAFGMTSLEEIAETDAGQVDLIVNERPIDIEGFDHLNVTFSMAKVYRSDGDDGDAGWTIDELNDTTVDLTQLGSEATTIANLSLKEGKYSKVELHVSNVVGILEGEEVEVIVPGGKLKMVRSFEVRAGDIAKFEFDIHLVRRGNQGTYNLLPVISKKDDNDKGKDDDKGHTGSIMMSIGKSKVDIGDFDHLNVTFNKVRIFKYGNNSTEVNWTEATLDNVTVDLTQLGSNATSIVNLSLEVGNYSKVELYVSDVIGIVDGMEVEVKVPSGKLMIVKDFNITGNETAKFVFDIKVVKRGHKDTYNLLPVISKNGQVGKDLDESEQNEI